MEEREDAERAFIRYYMEKPESDRPERFVKINLNVVNLILTPILPSLFLYSLLLPTLFLSLQIFHYRYKRLLQLKGWDDNN